MVVGTSIGSIVASLLRAGLSTDDLAAWASGVEPLPAGAAARTLIDQLSADPLRMTIPRLTGMLGGVRQVMPNARRLVRPSLAALSTMLPHGFIDAARALEQLGDLHDGWPADPLWLPAVRTRDGRRVVFGHDEHPPLGTAIAASCAIPLLLRPVRIGRHHYIDGATHSPTNADLLVHAGVNVAIVIAPMSGRSEALRRRPDHALREAFARRLRKEEQQLVRAGVDVHLFEPDARGLNALGINPIDRTRTVRVVPHAFIATGRQIDRSVTAVLRAPSNPPDVSDSPGRCTATAPRSDHLRAFYRCRRRDLPHVVFVGSLGAVCTATLSANNTPGRQTASFTRAFTRHLIRIGATADQSTDITSRPGIGDCSSNTTRGRFKTGRALPASAGGERLDRRPESACGVQTLPAPHRTSAGWGCR